MLRLMFETLTYVVAFGAGMIAGVRILRWLDRVGIGAGAAFRSDGKP